MNTLRINRKEKPLSESIRSFIAFDIDSDSVLKKLGDMQFILARTGADLKSVEPKNIHITLRFLGNIRPETVDKIHEILKTIQFASFNINICGIGAFPSVKYPRVVWAGIREGSTELRGIFEQLEPQLRTLGFAADSRGFSPHLTIARVRSARNKADLAQCIQENAEFAFGSIRGECLRLKSSDLTPKGPIYATLREFCPDKQRQG